MSEPAKPPRWSPWERGFAQEAVQRTLGLTLTGAGHLLEHRMKRRVARYRVEHAKLRRALGIEAHTPISTHGPALETTLAHWARGQRGPVAWAETSGTTRAPKRIPYSRARLRLVKWTFFAAFMRLLATHPLKRRSLYVFTTLDPEPASLTGMMSENPRRLAWLSTLQAPYRLHQLPCVRALAAEYGSTAVRMLVLSVTDPGVWYATNPSTLLQFVEGWSTDWSATRALADDLAAGRHREARAALFRAASRGAATRVERIAASPRVLDLRELFPSLGACWCWDGGYVAVFLDRLRELLDPHGVAHVPMYSMSTESLETATLHLDGRVRQVPMAPGVLAEFLPLAAEPTDARALLEPWALVPGEEYLLVLSHAYGLTRYQSEDVFRCVELSGDVPILEFSRRSGLAFSFTGEKLTEHQVRAVFDAIRAETPALAGVFMSCIPCVEEQPRYRVAVVGLPAAVPFDEAGVAAAFDTLLSRENQEYADKRRSGRLGAPDAFRSSYEAFSRWLGGASQGGSQLKLTALVPRLLSAGRREDFLRMSEAHGRPSDRASRLRAGGARERVAWRKPPDRADGSSRGGTQ